MNKFVSVVIPLVMLAACAEEKPATPEPVADLQAGKVFSQERCASCHGSDGTGVAPGIPHLAGQPLGYLQASLSAYQDETRVHSALRDLFAGISDQDSLNVAAYFASLPPVLVEDDLHVGLTAYEEGDLLAASCVECHGEKGNSARSGIPSLAGQQPLYFIAATQAYLQGTRDMSGMEETVRGLSKSDIEKLALFYASQTPLPRTVIPFGNPSEGASKSAKCSGCHGATGISHDASTPSLAGQDPQYIVTAASAYRGSVRQHEIMLSGKNKEDIRDIAAYFASQVPRAAEDEPLSAENLTRNCDRCHAPGQFSSNSNVPNLNGQDRDYLIMALRAYRDGRRESTMMHKMSMPYSDSMIESIASFYSTRSPVVEE